MQIKSAEHMVKSKAKSISNRGASSNFSKSGLVLRRSLLNIESIVFLKSLHEIEVAAICFVKECGLEYNTCACTGKTDLSSMKLV